MAMYEKRPTRWRDVSRNREDLFLPALTPWVDAEQKIAAVETAYTQLPERWDGEVEDELFGMLFDLFRHKRHHASGLDAMKPTVAEALAAVSQRTIHVATYDPHYPRFRFEQNPRLPRAGAGTRGTAPLGDDPEQSISVGPFSGMVDPDQRAGWRRACAGKIGDLYKRSAGVQTTSASSVI